MELKRQPTSEIEYWEAIEGLGGFSWRMNHDLADGRIKSTAGIEGDMVDAQAISERLVNEVCERYGVIHPKDIPRVPFGEKTPSAPEGKTYYWDWYERKKAEWLTGEYDKQICSVCPLSGGVEQFISTSGNIPCTVFNGVMYRLPSEDQCGMIGLGGRGIWSREELESAIAKKAVDVFVAKELSLRSNKIKQ